MGIENEFRWFALLNKMTRDGLTKKGSICTKKLKEVKEKKREIWEKRVRDN